MNPDLNPIPAIFVSHGTPMLALADPEEDGFLRSLRAFSAGLEGLKAVVAVSAHGISQGSGVQITAGRAHTQLFDFVGFPGALYNVEYSPPGDPALAARIAALLADQGFAAELSTELRLDHGVWIPLRTMFPGANVPVVQVSLPLEGGPAAVLRLGKALAPLRGEGVQLMGSGGAVHNLGKIVWHQKDSPGPEWARDFELWLEKMLAAKDVESLVEFETLGPQVRIAHPSAEHLFPIFFTLGAAWPGEVAVPIFRGIQYEALSMYSFALLPQAMPVPAAEA